MKLIAIAIALAAATPGSEASELKPTPPAAQALQLRSKAAIASVSSSPHRDAPFVSPLGEPGIDLAPRREVTLDISRSSCQGDRALCYDARSGRIVYKPARALMPDIPGLQPENISVKRDRIVFRYSF